MSRTYRKPLRTIERNLESYIKHSLSRRYRKWSGEDAYSTRVVKRKKPRDEYIAEYDAAWEEYHAKLKTASYDAITGLPYIDHRWGYNCGQYGLVPDYIRKPYVSRYIRVTIPWSLEEEIEELKKKYAQFSRDGHWNETSRDTGFKKAAAKTTRRANKKLERDILREEEYDHRAYPDHHAGDHLIWLYW